MSYRTFVLTSVFVLGASAAYASGGHSAQKIQWEGLRNNDTVTTSAPMFEGRSATTESSATHRETVRQPESQPEYFDEATQGQNH